MKIKSVIHKDYHDSIYGRLSDHPYVKAKVANPPEFISDMVGFKKSSPYLNRLGLRVAAIMVQYRDSIDKMLGSEYEGYKAMDLGDVMIRMRSCPPAGVITDKKKHNYPCDKFALCPFCRFRKAVEIGGKLESRLHDARWVAFIKISQPKAYEFMDHEFKDSYSKLIRSICVKRKLFMYDHIVTVPSWNRVRHLDGTWDNAFSVDTTIIGLVKKVKGRQLTIEDTDLPLPENCISENARKDMRFCGADSWRILPANARSVRTAMGYAMGCTPPMLSAKLDFEDYLEAMMLHKGYRAVSHGK